jgi:hypothetical protein
MKREDEGSLEDRASAVKATLDRFIATRQPAISVSNRQVLFLRPAAGQFDDTPWNGEWKNYTDR